MDPFVLSCEHRVETEERTSNFLETGVSSMHKPRETLRVCDGKVVQTKLNNIDG